MAKLESRKDCGPVDKMRNVSLIRQPIQSYLDELHAQNAKPIVARRLF
jgi:hypothetical protein